MVSAAVHENSGAPWPVPVSRREVLGEAVLVDQREGAVAQLVGELGVARAYRRPSMIVQLVFTQVGPFQ